MGQQDTGAAAPAPSSSSTAYPFPAGSVFVDGKPLPRLVVFDLDYTLWPFWVDTHVTPPFKVVPAATVAGSSSTLKIGRALPPPPPPPPGDIVVVDRTAEPFGFYQEVPEILQALGQQTGIKVGVASRTSAPDLARDLLKLLKVPHGGNNNNKTRKAIESFDALEIYPSNKLRHMEALHKKTGIPYEDFLFFDDESRNRNVETLGVTMCLVRDGVDWAEVERGVKEWRKRRGHTRAER